MVTLGGTQNFSEFELHARAVLGLPIPEIKLMKNGASAVVLANHTSLEQPKFSGLEQAMSAPDSDLRIFGKPTSRPFRRMAVTLTYGKEDVDSLVERAKKLAAKITIN
jgi:phosphoribosylglycinamide formyltransferase 2